MTSPIPAPTRANSDYVPHIILTIILVIGLASPTVAQTTPPNEIDDFHFEPYHLPITIDTRHPVQAATRDHLENYFGVNFFREKNNGDAQIEFRYRGVGSAAWVTLHSGRCNVHLQSHAWDRRETILHELLHCLGFADSYTASLYRLRIGSASNASICDGGQPASARSNYQGIMSYCAIVSYWTPSEGDACGFLGLGYIDQARYFDIEGFSRTQRCLDSLDEHSDYRRPSSPPPGSSEF